VHLKLLELCHPFPTSQLQVHQNGQNSAAAETGVIFSNTVTEVLVANLVANDAANLSKVAAWIFSLNVFAALRSEHNVATDLPHFIGCLVFQLQASDITHH